MIKTKFPSKLLIIALVIVVVIGQRDDSFCSELMSTIANQGKIGVQSEAFFVINDKTIIISDSKSLRNALYLRQEILRSTGIRIPVVNSKKITRNRNVILVSQSLNSHAHLKKIKLHEVD